MKKKNILVLLGFLFMGIFFLLLAGNLENFSLEGNAIKNNPHNEKVSKEILSKFNNEERIPVIVEFDMVSGKNSSSILKGKAKKIPGKVRHDFGDRASLKVTQEELEELGSNPGVKKISLVGKKQLFLQESTQLVNSTFVNNIEIENSNLTGKGETVCVLDTGVNFSHPDLQGKNETCVVDCTVPSCVEKCDLSDFHGHGTHCAGIIGANGSIKGVAPEAGLIGIKVCQEEGGGVACYDDQIRAGIDWCVGNKDTYNISGISLSLGQGEYSDYCDGVDDPSDITGAINNAVGENISVLVATGNDGSTSGIASPACIENATPVADVYDANVGSVSWSTPCTDSSTQADKIVCHANRNNLVDLFAPGALIESTWKTGYNEIGGTSMAAPHVAGAFALINQYKKQESSKTLRPSEIENSLNETGKIISDLDSGLEFSRIDVSDAILFLDEKAPFVNLISLQDDYNGTIGNKTFVCNSTDELQLENMTFRIWNSSGVLINETFLDATENFLEISKTLNLSKGDYEWNCISYDSQGNKGFSETNYSLSLGSLILSLSPGNNTYSNEGQSDFVCNSSSTNALENISYYLWNSSNLIYNLTKNISGEENTTKFNYTFEEQGEYYWNCLVYDNETSKTSSNYTFVYDDLSPNISLISPEENYSSTGPETIEFKYSFEEENIANCSLIINNETNSVDYSLNASGENTFTETLSEGNYTWIIDCFDLAGNSRNSSERKIFLEKDSSETSSSGGGGSSSSTTQEETEEDVNETKNLTILDLSNFYDEHSFNISRGEKLTLDFGKRDHEFILESLGESVAEITIKSEEVNLVLSVNDSRKINLDSDNLYDIYLKLNSILGESANFSIKGINESIPSNEIFESENISEGEEENGSGQEYEDILFWIVGGIFVLTILFIIYQQKSN